MNNVSMAPCHHSQIQIKLTLGEFIILWNVRVKVSVHMINKKKDLRNQFTVLKKFRWFNLWNSFLKKQKSQHLTLHLTLLKQNLLFDSSSAPRLEFYFILFSLNNHMHWDLYTYISLYYELTLSLFIWICEWGHGALETCFFYIVAIYS